MDTLNILQWNARSAVSNKISLELLLEKNNINVALISETWFKSDTYYNFYRFNTLRSDRPDGKGGVAILVKNNLRYKELNLPNIHNMSCKGITILAKNNEQLNIVSVYIKPRTRISSNTWNVFFSSIPKPFVVGGDFNAHHLAWGCETNDVFGQNLMDSMDDNNIIYLNDGSPTYITHSNRQKSAIDLTLCSADIKQLMDWAVILDPHGSDHLPILINCTLTPDSITFKNYRKWKIQKANWHMYYHECEKNFSNNNITSYTEVINNINISAQSSIPANQNNSIKNTAKHKQWWTEECSNEVQYRKESFYEYKENPTLANLLKYKESDARAKRTIKRAKRDAWKKYCCSLNKNTPMKSVWENVNKYRNRRVQNYTPVDSMAEWIPDFHAKITPNWVNQEIPAQSLQQLQKNTLQDNVQSSDNNALNRPFTMQELNNALKQNSNSSPGKDQIHYSMLYNLPRKAKFQLLKQLNNIWKNKTDIPTDWQDYIIIPIIKKGQAANDFNSYRPITLASCVMKSYERLIKNRIEFWLEQNKLLPASQFGFRKGRSTQESILLLISDIQLAFTKFNSVSAVFIDIKGAYDNVNLNILFNKMQAIGIPYSVARNIYMLYLNRKIYIKTCSNLIGPRQTSLGLPQGSILSPLLYIIYTIDFDQLFDANIIKILQFADDICIYSEDQNIDTCNEQLEQALEQVNKWTYNLGLTVSEQKTTICTFTRKRFSPPASIQLANYSLPYKSNVKFLGVYLDAKLNWKQHISYICRRVENATNIIKAFTRHSWGSDPNIVLIFYRSLIRSIIDYGSLVFNTAAKTHLEKIERIKNKCLRMSIGYLKSTPVDVIEAECCEPPLQLRRKFLAEKFILKLYSKGSAVVKNIDTLAALIPTSKYWRHKHLPLVVESYNNLSNYFSDIYRSDNLPNYSEKYEVYELLPTIMIPPEHIDTPDALRNSLFLSELNNKWSNYEHIFTDGSLLHGNAGCAFYHRNNNNSALFKLKPHSSIYTAELTAILEAVKYCSTLSSKNFIIFSDSKSSLQKIGTSTPNSRMNHLIVDILKYHSQLKSQNKNLILHWIKGHIGIQPNEQVDYLAKLATIQGQEREDYKIPSSDLHLKIKLEMKHTWQNIYSDSTKGRIFKDIQPLIPSKPWFYREINRKYIQKICRMRSNHALTPQYQNKIGISDQQSCGCGELGTLQHCILECSENQHTEWLIHRLQEEDIVFPVNIYYLLSIQRRDIYNIIYEFICKSKLQL